jgi:hypothetical protein
MRIKVEEMQAHAPASESSAIGVSCVVADVSVDLDRLWRICQSHIC